MKSPDYNNSFVFSEIIVPHCATHGGKDRGPFKALHVKKLMNPSYLKIRFWTERDMCEGGRG